ncbi:MAG: mechanosensitive ion channel family protein, partial [Terriglobales bacterium]
KRIETAGRLLRGVATLVIVGIAILMALHEVHVDITPILTGAGVVGVAVGLGAQTVVRDLIVGVFLILENQIRVGDVITINGKTGLVEALRLRIIVLRAEDGAVHIFHNGSINEYANLTKDYSYAVLDVILPFQADLERASAVLVDIGKQLAADDGFSAKLAGPLEVLGVEALSGTTMSVRIRQRTVPMEQWAVDRELRRRIQQRFQKDQIALAAGN